MSRCIFHLTNVIKVMLEMFSFFLSRKGLSFFLSLKGLSMKKKDMTEPSTLKKFPHYLSQQASVSLGKVSPSFPISFLLGKWCRTKIIMSCCQERIKLFDKVDGSNVKGFFVVLSFILPSFFLSLAPFLYIFLSCFSLSVVLSSLAKHHFLQNFKKLKFQ